MTRYLRESDGDIYETADSLALTVSELLAIIANEGFVVVRHTGNVHGVAYSNDSGVRRDLHDRRHRPGGTAENLGPGPGADHPGTFQLPIFD